ncbi:MAG: radical SAM family heme chaperone HemW [Parahaliea sp.]
MDLPPLGLYIHLPWCERKCPYCDFNSHQNPTVPEDDYVDALLRDLDNELLRAQGREVATLFIGGGTPSLFSAAAITRLMEGIGKRLPLATNLEATMEANPGSAEASRFAGYRAAGINRLSLGIQSFCDQKLQALGRIHTAEQAHTAIALVRAAGFEHFNLDLMHGLPGQSMDEACADLLNALAFKPPHLSWYQLTIEANTVFYKRPPVLPIEDTLACIQETGEQILVQAGLKQYEVSAWSQPDEACRHNLNYWQFGDYLAIGAGAHGKISYRNGRIERYAKRRQPEDYLKAETGSFQASQGWLQERDLPGEYMMNALRLPDGCSLSHFEARTGLKRSAISNSIDRLVQQDLLQADGEQLSCTSLGWRFLDTILGEFF